MKASQGNKWIDSKNDLDDWSVQLDIQTDSSANKQINRKKDKRKDRQANDYNKKKNC